MSEYALKLSDVELDRYRFMAEAAARQETDLWRRAGVVEGATVVDLGCGPGAMSAVLATLVGPTGTVQAVDRDPDAIEAARALAARAGLTNVTATTGEAHRSGLAPASADAVMIRHVLAHNGGHEQAIVDHAASLVRPGGWVYLVDIDISATRTRPEVPEAEELTQRYEEWHRRQGNDLAVGLRLGELLRDAGLHDVEHHGRYQIFPVPAGFRPPAWAARSALLETGLATPDDVARWEAAFARHDASEQRPTVYVPLFFAFGRRPAV